MGRSFTERICKAVTRKVFGIFVTCKSSNPKIHKTENSTFEISWICMKWPFLKPQILLIWCQNFWFFSLAALYPDQVATTKAGWWGIPLVHSFRAMRQASFNQPCGNSSLQTFLPLTFTFIQTKWTCRLYRKLWDVYRLLRYFVDKLVSPVTLFSRFCMEFSFQGWGRK